MSTIRAWSALAALLAALALGTRLLPPAATSPFLHHGTAVDRIALEGASLVLLGADGTRADLFAESLRVEHLSLDDALFTAQRGLVQRENPSDPKSSASPRRSNPARVHAAASKSAGNAIHGSARKSAANKKRSGATAIQSAPARTSSAAMVRTRTGAKSSSATSSARAAWPERCKPTLMRE